MSHSTGPDASRRTVSYRDLFSVPGYSPLLAAQAVSRLGDSVHYVALVALVFSLTRSGLSVSVAVVFEALPVIMFGAVAGAVVDRLPRRRVMLVADVVRCGLALLMAQTSTIPAIYALAFGLALAGVFSCGIWSSSRPETMYSMPIRLASLVFPSNRTHCKRSSLTTLQKWWASIWKSGSPLAQWNPTT